MAARQFFAIRPSALTMEKKPRLSPNSTPVMEATLIHLANVVTDWSQLVAVKMVTKTKMRRQRTRSIKSFRSFQPSTSVRRWRPDLISLASEYSQSRRMDSCSYATESEGRFEKRCRITSLTLAWSRAARFAASLRSVALTTAAFTLLTADGSRGLLEAPLGNNVERNSEGCSKYDFQPVESGVLLVTFVGCKKFEK